MLMTFAMFLIPMMDGISKLLSTSYDVTPGQITFGRFLVQACLLAPIILWRFGVKGLIPRHWFVNLLRGSIMSIAVLLFFVTLRYMPIADAIAVFFVEPFILTILSVIFLKEKVGWRRILAVLVGFAGAMFIVQPSYEIFGLISLLPIGTAFLFAIYLLITRLFGSDDDPLTMQFAAGIGGTITLLAAMVLGDFTGIEDIASPGIPEFGIRWGLIFAIGALAAVGHLLIVLAFRMANASLLAPLQYVEIVGATVLGYFMFGDFPDALKWLGIAIIISSGLYLYFRERHVSQ
ncbi:MAG: EamA family transporter [Hyphomicrobiales bacterium]|nr:MAG: EamA family transporter [Hyphomicrobiales bacterium]